MVQKEVAEKICNTRKRSILSLSVEIFAKPEICFFVDKTCFSPVPKVDSAIIKLTLRPTPLIPPELEKHFFTVVQAGFSRKRKKLGNVLGPFLGIESAKLLGKLDPNRRAETLSVSEWLEITQNFKTLQ